MRSLQIILLLQIFVNLVSGQPGHNNGSLGDLPNFIPPTPEVTSILKANFLSASPNTGAANITIPICALSAGNFELPISLNYNTTGIKVDEIASMVGLGWSLNYGGVIGRTVMDVPDEVRDPLANNWIPYNFQYPNYTTLDFLGKENADKQSDIFTFSFGGYNGKFILDQNLVPKPLSQYNLKISVINGAFMEGFIIVTDNGTEYHFLDEETNINRNLIGTNCKTSENEHFEEVKTSWYLPRIVLPSRQKEINFTYISGVTRFRNGRNESLTMNVAYENHFGQGAGCPSGPACSQWETRFSSCSREQLVSTKFISKIETSDGNKIEFIYDEVGRSDLMGGLRLATIKLQNYKGRSLKYVHFNSVYKTAIDAINDFEAERLF